MRTNRTLAAATLLIAFGAAPGLEASDTKGYLYGTIRTKGGTTYEGRLRWGTEEAFWTDHFNATKEDRPLVNEIPRRHRDSAEPMRIFGVPIGIRWSEHASRQLVVRFGDLKSILPEGAGGVTIVLKDGEEMRLGGGSNDVGARVTVHDATLGEVRLPWEKIRRVDFKAAPAELPGAPARLQGTVRTEAGTFRGTIQWDKDECLATDILDGTSEDGRMKIEMGKIRAIEREGFRASRVFLKDGREVVLRGTNDVNDDNRGIFVDDARYGRVLVSWTVFERVDFEDGGSGPGYDDFPPLGPLRGKLTTREGMAHKGYIVFDVDESRGWEMLDGDRDGVTYSIPFADVASIARTDARRSKVVLRGSREEIFLGKSTDVTDRNAGVFVLAGEKKTYVPWDEVARIDFER